MLPVVDYGSIAVVVPMISAVGGLVKEKNKFGFEIFLMGNTDPLVVGFDNEEEAEESRNELVAIVAQYHLTRDLGPDFEIDELFDSIEEDDFEDDDEDEDDDIDIDNKKEH